MKYGLEDKDIQRIEDTLAKYPQVDKVILYGSRAKGNYRRGSDIDLTLVGQGLNLDVLSSLELDIDDLLLPYFFDISIFTQIDNEDLVDHIKRVGQVFYERTTYVEATPAP